MSQLELSTAESIPSLDERPSLDPHPLSPYVAWAGKRNRDSILNLFKEKFTQDEGTVLELASGSGFHINYFASHFQNLIFQPSDLNEEVFEKIRQTTQEAGVNNVNSPIKIDLTTPETWSALEDRKFDAIFVINIFQVAPIAIADGIARIAASHLKEDGSLYIYGPFKVNGDFATPSNEEFDRTLRSYGVPEWGLKDVEEITQSAENYGLRLKETVNLPANNFILIYGE
jgi:cyclopropane fatty-acyl-phospholipid synthase-like methyltransferase